MSFGETESSMSLPSRKTQHLLPKSVFDRSGSDRWNLASTTFLTWDRWFESGSLQRRVRCELRAPHAVQARSVRRHVGPGRLDNVQGCPAEARKTGSRRAECRPLGLPWRFEPDGRPKAVVGEPKRLGWDGRGPQRGRPGD